jgi:predicted O-methyltransferase YrrM
LIEEGGMQAEQVTAHCEHVPGISAYLGERLWRLVRDGEVSRALDIGTGHGKAALYLAAGLRAKGRGKVVSVDAAGAQSLQPNLAQLGNELGLTSQLDWRTSSRGYPWTLARMLLGGEAPFDFVHFDGAHVVDIDAGAWAMVERLLRPGGAILYNHLRWQPPADGASLPSDYRATMHPRLVWQHLVLSHPNIVQAVGDGRVGVAWKKGPRPAFTPEQLRALYPARFWADAKLGGPCRTCLRKRSRREAPETHDVASQTQHPDIATSVQD